MHEQFVTYEIAKRLKELGFNEPCFTCYSKKNQSDKECRLFDGEIAVHNWNEYSGQTYSAPLWQQAIDWLREEHGRFIDIVPIGQKDKVLAYNGRISNLQNSEWVMSYNVYEQAREAAIIKALTLIKQYHERSI